MKCPITGLNIARALPAMIAGFITLFLLEWGIHGVMLADIYAETPNLWRSPDEMDALFPWMLLGQFVLVDVLVFIYSRNCECKGWTEGLRFGAMIGLLLAVLNIMVYLYMPISLELAMLWAGAVFVEMILVGIVIALIYRPCGEGSCCGGDKAETCCSKAGDDKAD